MADQVDLARELLVLAADDLTAATALADVAAVSDTISGSMPSKQRRRR
jgi:hypothetical protein